jgi:hypothetical protein
LRARDAGIRHVVLATSYRADVFADALETALSTACKACKWTTRSVPTPSAGSSTRRPAGTGR